MAIHFFEILFNTITQCHNIEAPTRNLAAIGVHTSYPKQLDRNIDNNNIVSSQSRGSLPYNLNISNAVYSQSYLFGYWNSLTNLNISV
jgi:hypothetical protein